MIWINCDKNTNKYNDELNRFTSLLRVSQSAAPPPPPPHSLSFLGFDQSTTVPDALQTTKKNKTPVSAFAFCASANPFEPIVDQSSAGSKSIEETSVDAVDGEIGAVGSRRKYSQSIDKQAVRPTGSIFLFQSVSFSLLQWERRCQWLQTRSLLTCFDNTLTSNHAEDERTEIWSSINSECLRHMSFENPVNQWSIKRTTFHFIDRSVFHNDWIIMTDANAAAEKKRERKIYM